MMRHQITWYWLNGQNSSPILLVQHIVQHIE